MNKRFLLVLEIVWIIVAILCIAAGIRYLIKFDGSRIIIFFLMALVSIAFAWIRHRQRKKN
jgi:hypothetical protein